MAKSASTPKKSWRIRHGGYNGRHETNPCKHIRKDLPQKFILLTGPCPTGKTLAEDLQCSDKTIERWLSILESLYVVFKVLPFHRNIARSILKSPKYYFYDTGQVPDDPGMKLENLVACALVKEMHFREDCLGEKWNIYYLKNKDGREIDFLITKSELPKLMLEVKWSDAERSPNFSFFDKYVSGAKQIQIVKELKREKTYADGTEIRLAQNWLSEMRLGK